MTANRSIVCPGSHLAGAGIMPQAFQVRAVDPQLRAGCTSLNTALRISKRAGAIVPARVVFAAMATELAVVVVVPAVHDLRLRDRAHAVALARSARAEVQGARRRGGPVRGQAGGKLTLKLPALRGEYAGERVGRELKGNWTQLNNSLPLTLTKQESNRHTRVPDGRFVRTSRTGRSGAPAGAARLQGHRYLSSTASRGPAHRQAVRLPPYCGRTSPYWKLIAGISYAPHVLGAAKKKSSVRRRALRASGRCPDRFSSQVIHGHSVTRGQQHGS